MPREERVEMQLDVEVPAMSSCSCKSADPSLVAPPALDTHWTLTGTAGRAAPSTGPLEVLNLSRFPRSPTAKTSTFHFQRPLDFLSHLLRPPAPRTIRAFVNRRRSCAVVCDHTTD